MKQPNFFIVGAMKAGTTALYYIAMQHPQIFMSPVKEPNYFLADELDSQVRVEDDEIMRDESAYLDLFEGVVHEKLIGEASHSYLYYSSVANRLYRYLPEARIVCILRNPVDRAFSHHLYHLRDGREPISKFEKALEAENVRVKSNIQFGHYFHRGLYFNQLKRYFDFFDQAQIKIFLHEDLKIDPQKLSNDLYKFLEVDVQFVPEASIIRNPSGIPQNILIHNLLVKPNPIKSIIQPILPDALYRIATRIRDRNLVRPELSPDLRSQMVEFYKDDIIHLQNLIQRDLSSWMM